MIGILILGAHRAQNTSDRSADRSEREANMSYRNQFWTRLVISPLAALILPLSVAALQTATIRGYPPPGKLVTLVAGEFMLTALAKVRRAPQQ